MNVKKGNDENQAPGGEVEEVLYFEFGSSKYGVSFTQWEELLARWQIESTMQVDFEDREYGTEAYPPRGRG